MTTPTGPRDARVVLSADTAKYVTALRGAATETEAAAGRMVTALRGVAAEWGAVAAAAKAAGAVNPNVASGSSRSTTSTVSATRQAAAEEASKRRIADAVSAADRRHELAVQRIMNAELAAQNRINNSRLTGAREAAKVLQAQIAVADAQRTADINRAKVAEHRTRVTDAFGAASEANAVTKSRVRSGDLGVGHTAAVSAEKEAYKQLAHEQRLLAAQESAYTQAKTRLSQQRIKLFAAERVAAEQTARAEVQANEASIASSKAAEAAAAKRAAAAQRAAAAEQGRIFYAAGRDITSYDDLGRAATRFGVAAVAGFGIAAYAAGKWEHEFANVERVTRRNADGTKATTAEITKLGEELRRVATISPASLSELTEVATAAGQLGVAREFVARFTQSAVQLGVVTNLSAEQAATGIAKLIAQTGEGANRIQKIGSTLVALGNAGASTESQILAMGVRFAGAGRIAGLTSHEILALSSSMASVGIQSELGGSSMQRFLFKVYGAARLGGQALNNFAKVAGTSSDEFRRMFDDKPIAAILRVVGGLRQIQDAGGNAVSTLQQLGFYNVRDQRVVAALAASYGQLTKNVDLAADAYEKNTALLDAYNIKAQTTANQLKIQKNRINDAAITLGTVLLPYIERAAESLANLANMFASIPAPVRDVLVVVGAMVGLLSLLGGRYMLVAASVGRLTRAVNQLTLAQRAQAAAAGSAAGANAAAAATGGGAALAGAAAGGVAAGGLMSKLKGGASRLGNIASKVKGGPAGLAVLTTVLVGLSLANSQFGESADEAEKKTTALAAAMKYFAQTGQIAGQAVGVLGPNMERLQAAIASGDKGAWAEIDAGLTELVNTGEDKAAQIMFAEIAKQAAAAGKSTEFLASVLPGYTIAQTAAAQAAAEQAAELDSLAQELENYDAIINRVQTQLFGKERVARDIRAAWAELREELKKGGATLDEVRDAVTRSVSAEFDAINATNNYEQAQQSLRDAIKGTADETDDATDAMDRFREAIETALGEAFDPQDAADDLMDTIAEIKKRMAEAPGQGIAIDLSATGDSESARQNRDDIQELLREEARLFEMDVKLGNDPAKALAERRKEFEANLREIGYYDADIRDALAKFDTLPASIPAAAAATAEKVRRATLTGQSPDAVANRQDIPDLVASSAARIAQNLRLGMSEKQLQAIIADGKRELTSYLRSLGFSAKEIRPYVDRLDSIADGYRTATKTSGDFRESLDSQQATLEKLSALYSAAVGEFANEGLRLPEEITAEAARQAALFDQVGRSLGFSTSEMARFKSAITAAGAEFAGVQQQINGGTITPNADVSKATGDLNQLKSGYDNTKQDIQNRPVTVEFTARNNYLQWAFDGIAFLASWVRKNPIYLVFSAIGSAVGGTAGSVIKGAAAGAGIGAMAGTVIPGVGNLVGGVVGAFIGGGVGFLARADGGWVDGPGGPRDDRVPALLSAGEFVVNARAARKHKALLEGINGGGSSPYTAGMQMTSFAASLHRAMPTPREAVVNVQAQDMSALVAALGNRPVMVSVQIDRREIARALGVDTNLRGRTR